MESFSPLTAMIGGALIGLAAAVLWLGNGRIAGIAGILGHLQPPAGAAAWRATFLVALVLGTLAASYALPGIGRGTGQLVRAPSGWGISTPAWLAIAGVLTGIGTRIGSGCTSGHGVCGLARLSLRSLVAVVVFFGVAILTVTVTGIA